MERVEIFSLVLILLFLDINTLTSSLFRKASGNSISQLFVRYRLFSFVTVSAFSRLTLSLFLTSQLNYMYFQVLSSSDRKLLFFPYYRKTFIFGGRWNLVILTVMQRALKYKSANSWFAIHFDIQSTLLISTSVISNNRLSRRKNLVLVITQKSKIRL